MSCFRSFSASAAMYIRELRKRKAPWKQDLASVDQIGKFAQEMQPNRGDYVEHQARQYRRIVRLRAVRPAWEQATGAFNKVFAKNAGKRPTAQAGSFGLGLEAGWVRHPADWHDVKSPAHVTPVLVTGARFTANAASAG
ncbi:MAG: hypothetical protein ACK5JT_15985 [Hyphomicrobiaceae bacterium]